MGNPADSLRTRANSWLEKLLFNKVAAPIIITTLVATVSIFSILWRAEKINRAYDVKHQKKVNRELAHMRIQEGENEMQYRLSLAAAGIDPLEVRGYIPHPKGDVDGDGIVDYDVELTEGRKIIVLGYNPDPHKRRFIGLVGT